MHIYTDDKGNEYPSVTTILQILGSKEIIKWANYLGFKHIDYEKELERTADRGTLVHSLLQTIIDPSLNPKSIKFKDPLEEQYCRKVLANFNKLLSKYKFETIFTEKSFVSSKLKTGGTIDWYTKVGNLSLLIDFKTSKQVRLKHLLQLGGYYSLLKENGYPVDGAGIIIINDRTCTLYIIPEKKIIELSKKFDLVKDIYYFIEDANTSIHKNKYRLDQESNSIIEK